MTTMKIVPQACNSCLIEIPGMKEGEPTMIAQVYVHNGELQVIVRADMSNRGEIVSQAIMSTNGDVNVPTHKGELRSTHVADFVRSS